MLLSSDLCKNLTTLNKNLLITAFHSMFERHTPCGYAFKGEVHDFWECVYVRKGSICVSADERVYNISEGEIIFHKPMEFHKYHVEEKEGADLFIFSFTMTGKLSTFFENKVFLLNDEQKDIFSKILEFIHKVSIPYADLQCNEVFKILIILNKSSLHMQTLLSDIYRLFLSFCNSNISADSELTTENAFIYKTAVSFMNDNIDSSITVKEIAEKCCISATSLQKIFMEYAGIGIHKYFLKLRLNHAATLLAGGATTSAIAEIMNFSSQAYFSEVFKREMGVSPKEYRKNCTKVTPYVILKKQNKI